MKHSLHLSLKRGSTLLLKGMFVAVLMLQSLPIHAIDLTGQNSDKPSFFWKVTQHPSSVVQVPNEEKLDSRYWKFILGGCVETSSAPTCSVVIKNQARGEYKIHCKADVSLRPDIPGSMKKRQIVSGSTTIYDRDRDKFYQYTFGLGKFISPRAETIAQVKKYATEQFVSGLTKLTRELSCRRK